jgi:hypothetical protein
MSQVTSFSQVLEQEIETAWSETISNLTPEEKKMLMNSTPQDWAQAVSECAKSPDFWMSIGAAFVTGIAQGFSNAK